MPWLRRTSTVSMMAFRLSPNVDGVKSGPARSGHVVRAASALRGRALLRTRAQGAFVEIAVDGLPGLLQPGQDRHALLGPRGDPAVPFAALDRIQAQPIEVAVDPSFHQ